MFGCAYALIQKEDNFCFQVNRNNKPNWVIDNDVYFNLPIPIEIADQYLDKYYYDGKWWERVYDGETYTDQEFIPV